MAGWLAGSFGISDSLIKKNALSDFGEASRFVLLFFVAEKSQNDVSRTRMVASLHGNKMNTTNVQ